MVRYCQVADCGIKCGKGEYKIKKIEYMVLNRNMPAICYTRVPFPDSYYEKITMKTAFCNKCVEENKYPSGEELKR